MNRASPRAAAADRALGRADVGDDAVRGGEVEHLADDVRKLRDRCRDEDEIGAGHGVGEGGCGIDGLPLVSDAQNVGVGIPAAHGRSRLPGGERSGRADEARPDDGDGSKTAHR